MRDQLCQGQKAEKLSQIHVVVKADYCKRTKVSAELYDSVQRDRMALKRHSATAPGTLLLRV